MIHTTLTSALSELEKRGFVDQFRAEEKGLRATKADRTFEPEELVIEETARFEGDSNPAEQTLLFALASRDGAVRGTYTVAFGPEMDPRDTKMVRALESDD